MYVNFLQYILEKPNDCEMNYIDIYEDNFNEEKRKQRFCGTSTEPFKSDGNKVRIRFHAKPGALKAKFSLLYTSFRETQNKGKDLIKVMIFFKFRTVALNDFHLFNP